MTDTATETPSSITAGNSASWLLTFSDYPASAGWSVTFYLLNATHAIDFTSSALGDAHLIDLSAAATALYTAGDYKYTALITDGTDRYTVETGNLTILPDPSTLSTYDGRTHNEITLANIRLVIRGKATEDVLRYTIGGRELWKNSFKELHELESIYSARVESEKAKAAGKKQSKILTRFI